MSTKTPLSTLAGIPELEQHPIAMNLVPGGMAPEELDALTDDITERGLIYPIVLFEGKVLDGWHRYQGCVRSGTALKTTEYTGTDPAGFVASCTVLRRRLSSLQRALVAARMHTDHGVSQRDACKRFGISNAVLSMVLKALNSRNSAIIKRIESDADFTRGMLREDLSDAGIVHPNYGQRGEEPEEEVQVAPPPAVPRAHIANSVFALGDTVGSSEDDDDDDLIGGPLPDVGKKPHKAERRAKQTPAQHAQEVFKEVFGELSEDDQRTFLQMIWPSVRPLAEELKLPGMGKTAKAPKAQLKAVNE